MSRTIVNQGAATPVALLEGFRLVANAARSGEPVTYNDACSLLGTEGWQRLKEKLETWKSAYADARAPEVSGAVGEVLNLPWPTSDDGPATAWQHAVELVRHWD